MEEWRDIKGYAGYQVSNLGRVRTHNKVTKSARFPYRKWKDRILKQKDSSLDHYKRVELWGENGQHKTFVVHRLVADAFIPHEETSPTCRSEIMTVNHINRIRHDNRVENLEWLTLADNIRAAFDLGMGIEKPCKLKSSSGEILTFKSMAEASRFLGRCCGYVSNNMKRQRDLISVQGIVYQVYDGKNDA